MTVGQTLRIGIVGAGGIVLQRHLPGLKKISGVEIRAVANSTLESAQRFCTVHTPQADAIARWEDLVVRPDIDIVWIGAGPNLHKPVTLAALAAGKHVFCQARMAMNLADAREMLAAANARRDQVTMLCPAPQGLRSGLFFKNLLAEKAIGDLRMVRLQSLNDGYLDSSRPAHWRQRKEISGLNIMALGIHIEVLRRWFGTITHVQASGKVFTPERSGYRVEIPDVLNVLAEFDNGALSTWEFSSIHSGPAVEAIEVIGSRATLRYDYSREEISQWNPATLKWEILNTPQETIREWQVEADFIQAVRNPDLPRPYPTFEEGVAYMSVIQAVNDSMTTGKRIAISSQ